MATKKTQTQTKVDLDLNNIFKTDTARPIVKHTTDKPKSKPKAKEDKPKKVNLKQATTAKTLDATSRITPTKAMLDMMDRILDIDLDDDLPSYEASCRTELEPAKNPQRYTYTDGVEPKPPENLPEVLVKTTTLATTAEYALR